MRNASVSQHCMGPRSSHSAHAHDYWWCRQSSEPQPRIWQSNRNRSATIIAPVQRLRCGACSGKSLTSPFRRRDLIARHTGADADRRPGDLNIGAGGQRSSRSRASAADRDPNDDTDPGARRPPRSGDDASEDQEHDQASVQSLGLHTGHPRRFIMKRVKRVIKAVAISVGVASTLVVSLLVVGIVYG